MMLAHMEQKARTAARRAGLTAAGALFLSVGCGFMTAAGWMVLEEMRGALFATTVIGSLYLGLGLILLGVAASRNTRAAPDPVAHGMQPSPQTYAIAALLEAFMAGLNAGISKRRSGADGATHRG